MATVRDERKVVLHLGSLARPDVQIFSAAGQPLGRILWDKERITAAGWTTDEELLIVDERGHVHRYTPLGSLSKAEPFSLGRECEEDGLTDAVVTTSAIAALTVTGHLWYGYYVYL